MVFIWKLDFWNKYFICVYNKFLKVMKDFFKFIMIIGYCGD